MTNDNSAISAGRCRLLLFVALAGCSVAASAAGDRPAAAAATSTAAPEAAPTHAAAGTTSGGETAQRMRQDMQSVLSHMAESGALGQHPEHVSLRVEEPARRVSTLGALVDSTSAQSARDGLHVLGATPGSTADRLGLHPGDIIVAVNGTSLRGLGADDRGRALAATTLRSMVDGLPDSATLTVNVLRSGETLTLNAPVQAVYVPAMRVELGDAADSASAGGSAAVTAPADPPAQESCGRISAFDVAPRGERLYAARILLLDGTTPGPQGVASFRVNVGEHHLLVAENIPTSALGIGEIATFRHVTAKPLTVVVEAGKTAMIAARLRLAYASDLGHGTYWDPVVWKQVPEACH